MKKPFSRNILLLITLIDEAGLSIVYPIFAYYFMDPTNGIFNVSDSKEIRLFYLGILFAIYPLFMSIGSYPLGKLSDHWGRKKILLASLLGFCLGFALLVVGMSLHVLWLIILGRVVAGLTAGCELVANASMAEISKNEIEKTKNIAAVTVVGSLGFMFGPLIAGILSDSDITPLFTRYTPFIFIGFLGFIALILLYFFFEETTGNNKQEQHVDTLSSEVKLLKNRDVLYLSLTFFLFILGWNLFFQFAPVYLELFFHADEITTGFFMTFVTFIFTASVAIKPILKNLGLKATLLIGGAFLMISILIAINISMLEWFWVIIIPFCVGGGFVYISSIGLFSNAVSSQQQGQIMGLANIFRGLAWTLAPMLSGIIISIYIKLPMLSAAGCFILAVFFAFYKTYRDRVRGKLAKKSQ